MSLSAIDLPTNKSATIVDDDRREIRQSEKGLILSVIIQDANNSSYDLTGKTIQFNEMKDGGKVVIDDGNGPGSGTITVTDANAGEFDYTLQAQVYAASGTCWFAIMDGNTVIDTTKNFYFDVEPSATIHIDNDNYVSEMEAQLNNLKAVIQRVVDQLNATTTNADQTVQAEVDKTTSKLNDMISELDDYTEQYNNLQSEWDAELKKIQDAADTEQASIQSTADSQQKAIKDADDNARTAAIDAINDTFNKNLAALQQDYDAWKSTTVSDFTKEVSDLEEQLTTTDTDVQSAQEKATDLTAAVNKAEQEFSAVNFNDYVQSTEFDQFKTDITTEINNLGGVKTVDNISPDDKGNVETDHYTKEETDTKLDNLGQVKSVNGNKPDKDGDVTDVPNVSMVSNYDIANNTAGTSNQLPINQAVFIAPAALNTFAATIITLQNQIKELESQNYIEGYSCNNDADAETYSKAHPNTLVTVVTTNS